MSENWENTGSQILFFGYGLTQFSPKEKVATREAFLGVWGREGGGVPRVPRGVHMSLFHLQFAVAVSTYVYLACHHFICHMLLFQAHIAFQNSALNRAPLGTTFFLRLLMPSYLHRQFKVLAIKNFLSHQ